MKFQFIFFVILLSLITGKYGYPPKQTGKGIKEEKDNTVSSKQQFHNKGGCVKLNGQCAFSEDCCTGGCVQGACSENAQKGHRAVPPDHVKLIEMEMSTGNNIDVTDHPNLHLLAQLEECGRNWLNKKKRLHSRTKRIVGGTPYAEGKYPWLVSLHLNWITTGQTLDAFHCGGSLINKRYILTAAHCVTRIPTGLMLKYATLGNVDRRIKFNCEQDSTLPNCGQEHYLDMEIDDMVIHEQYSDSHVRNDIALLRLKHEVNYTDYIQPICLPRSEAIFRKWNDGRLTVAGWGNQNSPSDSGPAKFSHVAQEIDMVLVHRNSCDRFFTRLIGKLRRSQICVVGPPGKADCAGDSGGPLFKSLDVTDELEADDREARYFNFGLVSSGADDVCGREGKPSVFTNVIDYMPWILDHLVPKIKAVGDSVTHPTCNPVEEFATGFNMDVTKHRNVELLPSECGKLEGQLDHSAPNTPHSRKKRIVGGIVQSIGTFPWMAQVYVKQVVTVSSDFRCGGALITSRHVLTGAHCVADLRGPYSLDGVLLGNFNRLEKTECIGTKCIDQLIVPIEEIIVHEGFTKFAREHDVALIKLTHEVKFNRFIKPICLPLSEDIIPQAWPNPLTDRRYVAAGWGQVTANDDPTESMFSNILIGANFTLENKKYCEGTLLRRTGKLENTRICGGGSSPGRGECFGDTGGPMMRWVTSGDSDGETSTRMYIFGTLSVVECAHQGVPSLYQNLLYHMPWIMDHLDA